MTDELTCLVCHAGPVEPFLDLGISALANNFLAAEELDRPEPEYPLRVGFCHRCGHVQLTVRVPPSLMFEHYLYVSSASETLKAHFEDLAHKLVERHRLGRDDLVVDIGCNDASLLGCFRARGVRTLGVDPARNLAELAQASGIERYVDFFDARTAPEIVAGWGKAKLITATNTFPHIPDLDRFVGGIGTALAPGGLFVLEAHYLVDLLEQMAFDTVYHEHVSYWALGPMRHLFERHGMEIVRAERLPIHHGQLRVTVQRQGEGDLHPSVDELLAYERELGIGRVGTWHAFADRTSQLKAALLHRLSGLKRDGISVGGYGAPAKASTLLNYAGIGPHLVEAIVDRSPLKQGRYMPGSHIPIVPPEWIEERRPDVLLLLAWNFVSEIVSQQAAFLAHGGRFLVPVPEVRMIGPEGLP